MVCRSTNVGIHHPAYYTKNDTFNRLKNLEYHLLDRNIGTILVLLL